MDLIHATHTLGTYIVGKLQARGAEALIVIGSDRFTRSDLASAGCFNYTAAHRLSRALARFGFTNTRDLYRRLEPEQLALPQIGPFAVSVLGACFELRGIGTLDEWVTATRKKNESPVTFSTMKARKDRDTTKATYKHKRSRPSKHHTNVRESVAAVH